MTTAHCCGAEKIFDYKNAQKELKKYLKKGPGKSTKRLINSLSNYDKSNKSLLDVGSGVGSIMWDFLENGGSNTTDVDASTAYLETAKKYAQQQNWEDRVTFQQGDLTDTINNGQVFDFVTMDKVICCYPDYQLLLQKAMKQCKDVLAITFPIGGPLAHFFNSFTHLYLIIQKNPFRTYIHPFKEIEKLIVENGFEIKSKQISFPWRIWVFERQ